MIAMQHLYILHLSICQFSKYLQKGNKNIAKLWVNIYTRLLHGKGKTISLQKQESMTFMFSFVHFRCAKFSIFYIRLLNPTNISFLVMHDYYKQEK